MKAVNHKYEKMMSIGVTNLLSRFGIKGDTKAGRNRATDIVEMTS